MLSERFTIRALGDCGLEIGSGNELSEQNFQKLLAVKRVLEETNIIGVSDIVITFSSVAIFFDPSVISCHYDCSSAFGFIKSKLEAAFQRAHEVELLNVHTIEVPVCYDDDFGTDWKTVESITGLKRETVIAVHTAKLYRVFMVGFLPGFPYLGSVDARIRVPRKNVPSRNVPAGSVGIAGIQTGIYPFNSPGGWQIIGRTPWQLFEPMAAKPVKFEPGDLVRFFAVDRSTFHQIQRSQ